MENKFSLEASREFGRELIRIVKAAGFEVPTTMRSITVRWGVESLPSVEVEAVVPVSNADNLDPRYRIDP